MHAAIIEEAPLDITESEVEHPSLIYHLSHPTKVARGIVGSKNSSAMIGPRSFCITPGNVTTTWKHGGRPEILQIYLRQSLYVNAVNELYGCDAAHAELLPRFAILDPLLEQLAIATATALRQGNSKDGLYVDTLAQMMAVHLAVHHSSRSRSMKSQGTRTVPSWKIRRLVDFVEENLDRDLSLDAMAAEVGISPLYLPRVFKAAIGQTPHQYVLERRIERAKQLLRSTDVSIADIALAVGFSSQSHLSNWLSRTVGVSPANYRRQGF